jgi:hypothetical protein
VRTFAEHQPVTSVLKTLRDLLHSDRSVPAASLTSLTVAVSPESATARSGPVGWQDQNVLTIGQLAAYAGVTVRAVRHYHQIGLLPEPERDASGYRRYGAKAVVSLIRIRTLANAGVPRRRPPRSTASATTWHTSSRPAAQPSGRQPSNS